MTQGARSQQRVLRPCGSPHSLSRWTAMLFRPPTQVTLTPCLQSPFPIPQHPLGNEERNRKGGRGTSAFACAQKSHSQHPGFRKHWTSLLIEHIWFPLQSFKLGLHRPAQALATQTSSILLIFPTHQGPAGLFLLPTTQREKRKKPASQVFAKQRDYFFIFLATPLPFPPIQSSHDSILLR